MRGFATLDPLPELPWTYWDLGGPQTSRFTRKETLFTALNTRLNTSYTIYIVFILSATICYPSRNGTGFY
jgi:hypothetical protein